MPPFIKNPREDQERVWHYHIDSEGMLWHDGFEFDDPALLNLFMKNMKPLPDGSFHVFCQGEECILTCEDVPYAVQKVVFSPSQVMLHFPGGYSEALDPSTLFVGSQNVLYCKVRGGVFTARFGRGAYLDFAKRVQFDSHDKSFYLVIDNKKYSIEGVTN
jgi:hypothetical protein